MSGRLPTRRMDRADAWIIALSVALGVLIGVMIGWATA